MELGRRASGARPELGWRGRGDPARRAPAPGAARPLPSPHGVARPCGLLVVAPDVACSRSLPAMARRGASDPAQRASMALGARRGPCAVWGAPWRPSSPAARLWQPARLARGGLRSAWQPVHGVLTAAARCLGQLACAACLSVRAARHGATWLANMTQVAATHAQRLVALLA